MWPRGGQAAALWKEGGMVAASQLRTSTLASAIKGAPWQVLRPPSPEDGETVGTPKATEGG